MVKKILFVALIAFLNIRCESTAKKDLTETQTSKNFDEKMDAAVNFQDQMQTLEKNLITLYPLALDSSDFSSSKNEATIKDSLKKLTIASAKVNHSPMTVMNDPTLAFISFDFKHQIANIESAFSSGKKDFARFELLKVTQYCVECHTQSNKGPNFGYSQFAKKIEALPAITEAEVYLATRRFDDALKSYEEFFKEKDVTWDSQVKAEMAAHNALSILIRYKRDPAATLAFIDVIEKSTFVPVYLKQLVPVWKKDIQKWKSEIKKTKSSLALVKMWIERSNARLFEYGRLGSEVWNQLSISYLHEFLENIKFKQHKADVLWMLGTSYINGLNPYQSSLGEKYLEVCIRTFPNSFSAHRCYFKLEEYTYETNSGSAGTFLAPEDEKRLKDLKKMSEPK